MILIPNLAIYLLFLVGLITIVFSQNSRSIFIRLSGLILVFVTAILGEFTLGINENNILELILMITFGVSGILSDYYSATLRTWFFSVSARTMMITQYGILLGLLFFPSAFGMGLTSSLLFGTMLGAFIGELSSQTIYNRSISRALKSMLGTVIGLYGMGTKVLLGLMIVNLFV
jgi:uncharacterized protein YqgC (DUF456 family)